jgi:RluA family pseudouridine synthase
MLESDASTTVGARRAARNAATVQLHVNGLRYVTPFEAVAVHWVKDQHEGLSLAECCTDMFGSHGDASAPLAYWNREIIAGRVQLKRKRKQQDDPVPTFRTFAPEEPITRQCQIKVLTHVHERVTSAADPLILFEDETMLVVNKPAGVPTQDDVDGGSTVAALMRRLRPELTTLRPVHRLDLGVSGALILAKGGGVARQLMRAFEERRVDKVYLARVLGKLPSEERLVVSTSQVFRSREGRAVVTADDVDGAKATRTDVCHVADCGDGTSLVECRLHSGRRHQIRCHLASLGHPIANDERYGGRAPRPDGPRIYQDDQSGALRRMLEEASVSWCDKCAWCLAAVSGALVPPLALEPLWLHARSVAVLPDGPRVEAPLPWWAKPPSQVGVEPNLWTSSMRP